LLGKRWKMLRVVTRQGPKISVSHRFMEITLLA
jgi:hypothetical protein